MSEQSSTVPETLRLLREFRGLSGPALAREAHVSSTTISKIESGKKTTTAELTAQALAEALEVRAETLGIESLRPVNPEALHFRKRSGTRKALEKQLVASGALFEHAALVASEGLDLPEPSFSVGENVSPKEAAAECRRRWGIRSDAPIVNLTGWIEKAGAIVGTLDNEAAIDGFSWARPRPMILLNKKAPPSRQRFSLAHECGHLVLHQGAPGRSPERELQANEFASELLFPESASRREFPQSERLSLKELLELKKRWGMSLQALLYCAHARGLIQSRHYRHAMIYLSQKGWRKAEPGEEPSPESPRLLPSILKQLYPDGRALAERSQMSLELLEALLDYRFKTQANGSVLKLSDFRKGGV